MRRITNVKFLDDPLADFFQSGRLRRRPKQVAIAAQRLRIMVRPIGMARVAHISLRHLPLMRSVAHRAVRSGMGRFEMKLGALGMAGHTGHDRFHLLFLQMAGRAGKRRHGSPGGMLMASRAIRG